MDFDRIEQFWHLPGTEQAEGTITMIEKHKALKTKLTDEQRIAMEEALAEAQKLISETEADYILLTHLDELSYLWSEGDVNGVCYWLVLGTEVVAYLKVLQDRNRPRVLTLSEIEVRPDRRGQGLAKEIVAAVEIFTKDQVYSDGDYTQDGYQKLSHWIPTLDFKVAKSTFRDQSFVVDWDNLETAV